jgi:phosphoserine phosphatase RsbU/P
MPGQWAVLAAACGYLLFLFAIAYFGDRQRAQGRSIIANPYIYTLSLGVYATSWTFFGSVGRAATWGMSFLAIYLGPTIMAFFFWFLLRKLLRICKENNVTTLADFLALRYGKGPAIGALATIAMLLALVPYNGLQLTSVSETFLILTKGDASAAYTAPIYQDTGLYVALIMAAFSILFGARHLDPTERHEGMVAAMAFESVAKLAVFLVIGILVTFVLFNGWGDIWSRICRSPQFCDLPRLDTGPLDSYVAIFVQTVLAMFAIVFLPRQFHMAVVENTDEKHLLTAMWLLPLYLLLINLFVVPVAFGGLLLGLPAAAADTFVLRIPLESGRPYVAMLAFLGGLSASTAMVATSAIAVSTMLLNSLIMPLAVRIKLEPYLTPHLLTVKRACILFIVLLGYASYRLIGHSIMLVDMGLIAFCGIMQVVPAILGAMYWKKATRFGAITGLALGILSCGYMLVFPYLVHAGWFPQSILTQGPFGLAFLSPVAFLGLTGLDYLSHAFFWSMFVNVGAFVAVSWLTAPTPVEEEQARHFVDVFKFREELPRGTRFTHVPTLEQFTRFMTKFVGKARAFDARQSFLQEVHLPEREWGDQEKMNLAVFVERTIAASIGPAAARVIVDGYLTSIGSRMEHVFDLFGQISSSLEESQEQLKRRVAELSVLYEAAQKLTSSLYLPDLIEGVLDLLVERLLVERCAVRLLDHENCLAIKSFRGLPPQQARQARTVPEMRSLLGQCLLTPQVVSVSDSSIVLDRLEGLLEEEAMNSFVLAPITTETLAMGVLSAASSQKGYFAREHVDFFQSLARQMGLAVRSAQLVAHEIRNPVYAIDGFAHRLCKKLPQDSDTHKYAEIIIKEAHRLQHLVNEVVETAVIFIPREEEHDLNEVIKGGLGLIHSVIEAKKISLEMELAPELPPLTMDVGNMKRVILQLATNALEAMAPGGTLTLITSVEGGKVVFQVRDTGKGIPASVLPHIFDTVFSSKPGGPGLGLPIVRKIIVRHQGEITIDSQENVGTTVTVRLPAAKLKKVPTGPAPQ